METKVNKKDLIETAYQEAWQKVSAIKVRVDTSITSRRQAKDAQEIERVLAKIKSL